DGQGNALAVRLVATYASSSSSSSSEPPSSSSSSSSSGASGTCSNFAHVDCDNYDIPLIGGLDSGRCHWGGWFSHPTIYYDLKWLGGGAQEWRCFVVISGSTDGTYAGPSGVQPNGTYTKIGGAGSRCGNSIVISGAWNGFVDGNPI
ncbi:unnamed protein product, partial [marine sediment metagenome]